MKARNELNVRLYEQKMDERHLPYPEDTKTACLSIRTGDSEAVSRELVSGKMKLIQESRTLSDNDLRNAMYHFILSAYRIADACMEGGLSHDEAHALSEIYILKADKTCDIPAIESCFRDMCMDFAERMSEIRKHAGASPHVRKCIRHIYENLGSDLSLKTLAETLGLNPSYLSRLFARETGTPVSRFVLEARIDTAGNLLKYSNLPCSKISASLGFSSQSAFIAAFRQVTGLTPGAYRKQH